MTPFGSGLNNCSANTFQYVLAVNSIQQYSRPLVTHDWHLSPNSDWMWGNSMWSSQPNINPNCQYCTLAPQSGYKNQTGALSLQVFCLYFVQWEEVETWQALFSFLIWANRWQQLQHAIIIFENLKTCHKHPTICSLIKSNRGSSATTQGFESRVSDVHLISVQLKLSTSSGLLQGGKDQAHLRAGSDLFSTHNKTRKKSTATVALLMHPWGKSTEQGIKITQGAERSIPSAAANPPLQLYFCLTGGAVALPPLLLHSDTARL